MTDWTDDQRREFNEYRRAGKEHVELGTVRIRVGDRVATPGGSGYAVEERLAGFLVKLEAAAPSDDSGAGSAGDGAAGGDVFYLPLSLLRKLDV
jgi:hypothetical protein